MFSGESVSRLILLYKHLHDTKPAANEEMLCYLEGNTLTDRGTIRDQHDRSVSAVKLV